MKLLKVYLIIHFVENILINYQTISLNPKELQFNWIWNFNYNIKISLVIKLQKLNTIWAWSTIKKIQRTGIEWLVLKIF